jgi:hypothetical protein
MLGNTSRLFRHKHVVVPAGTTFTVSGLANGQSSGGEGYWVGYMGGLQFWEDGRFYYYMDNMYTGEMSPLYFNGIRILAVFMVSTTPCQAAPWPADYLAVVLEGNHPINTLSQATWTTHSGKTATMNTNNCDWWSQTGSVDNLGIFGNPGSWVNATAWVFASSTPLFSCDVWPWSQFTVTLV